jgi:protocatechuate 3,4-dioxygenase beta subunit
MLTVALLAILLTGPAQGNATEPSKQVPQTTPSSDQEQGYRVIGTVVDSTTGAPLSDAQVTITSLDTQDAAGMLTDENGRFAFEDVPSGKYMLFAKRKGYLEQLYKQHQQFSTAIITGPGLNTENLRFELRQGASISGVVIDEAGEPVRNTQVSLLQQELLMGQPNTSQRKFTNTNDLGQFRFGGLLRGTYFLAVSATPWYAQRGSYFINRPRNSDGTPQIYEPEMRVIPPEPQLDVVYPLTFFPNSPDLAGAAPIALHSGDAEVADFHLQAVPGSRMILRIPVTKEGANVWANVTQPWIEGHSFNVAAAIQPIAPGILEISGLPTGRVDVRVYSNGIPRWRRTVQVSGDNSEINIGEASRLVKVTGVARFTDGLSPNIALRFHLKSTTTDAWYKLASQKDGTFELQQDGLPPGQYEIRIMQSREEEAVRNIKATNAKVLSSRAFEITGTGDVKLEVLMSRGTGNIAGFALKDGKPVDGVMVALVPDDSERNLALFRRDQSNSDGSFNLTGIHPGKYNLIALENGWDIEWLEPGILKKYLAAGERVEVVPNAKLEVKLRVQ